MADDDARRIRRPTEYRDIPGYEGLYGVTKDGRVWSHQRYRRAGRAGWRIVKGRWLKLSVHRSQRSAGYLKVVLYKDDPYKGRSLFIHQLVMSVWGPPKPSPRHEVNHQDLDKTHNHIGNLEWVTSKENKDHYRLSLR